jgi:hypothetical protein
VNLLSPLQKLESESRVDEADEPEIVTGVEPITVNPVHDTEPEHEAVVVAAVDTNPFVPVYARP